MHVSVTALGAPADRARTAAGHVVDYLAASGSTRLGRAGSRGDGKPLLGQESAPGAYYSDTPARSGRWRGQQADTLGDVVTAEQLTRALVGQDPLTGHQLVSAQGSSGRTALQPVPLPAGPPDELFTLDQAAGHIGVDTSYLRRLAVKTATYRSSQAPPTGALTSTDPPTGAFLDAAKVDGRWQVTRAEIDRFVAARKQPQVVIGYDVTFSAPKSLSILWATGSPEVRTLCENAFEAGVAAAVDYLERNAVWVRQGRGYEPAAGMLAASYRHDTNRELEPQLHEHVVIANMATGPDGRVQALDARGLYAHATTAGHLAQAQMQHHSNRRGLAWTPIHRGIANVAGVPDDAIRAMSTRREQVLSLAGELGSFSAHARQTAALATRAAKDHGVDRDQLAGRWQQRLADVGFGPAEIAAATAAAPTRLWTPEDTERLDAHLTGPHGVTEMVAVFDRRDVIQAIVDHSGGRLDAQEVLAHADRWLHTDAVIPLNTTSRHRQEVIGQHGKVALAADATYYSTPTMIALEENIARSWQNGHDQHAAEVPSTIIEGAIRTWEQRTGLQLGEDQAAMVRAICGSGDRYQAVIGPAGSGKTAALEVAARAWENAGYRVIGAAVNGTAAEVLARSTGIPTRTVAGLVTRLDTADRPVIDQRTVIIIDEASTLGNRHHSRLTRHIDRTGATLRAVGDPAQHGAVEAGGMWNELTRRHPGRTPRLTKNRRQSTPEMADVRLATADYRAGRIADALQRLDTNQRIITAPTTAELLDQLAADWYVDRTHTGRPSRMIAEHHHERRALNTRAQALLHADGTLTGPGVRIGEATFHVGDEVIARAQNRHLRPAGGDRNSYLRNGTTGRVLAITGRPGREDLLVDFEGRGPIRVPHDWLVATLRPGVVGGLAPAYAVTSHAAQGDTYRTGRMLAHDGSQPEAVYVGLTRGTQDTRIYTVKREPASLDTDPQLPRIDDQRTALEALTEQLAKPRPADLATTTDPTAAHLVQLANRPLQELDNGATPLHARAARLVEERTAHAAINTPADVTTAELGHRETHPDASAWDHAAVQAAVYRARWDVQESNELLPPPGEDAPHRQRDDHATARQAVSDAQATRLANIPTAELSAEWRQLNVKLAGTPYPDPGILQARLDRANQRLTAAEALETALKAEHKAASTQRARRRDPDGPERTRRELQDATHTVAAARTDVATVRLNVDSLPDDITARRRVADRLEAVDRALDHRVHEACEHPAGYLADALGPRSDASARRWDAAAKAIETYRHKHLGLEPGDPPLRGDEPLGFRPDNPQGAQAWAEAIAAINANVPSPPEQSPLRIGR